jgi:hypothetical protein
LSGVVACARLSGDRPRDTPFIRIQNIIQAGVITEKTGKPGEYYAPNKLEQSALEAIAEKKISQAGQLYDQAIVENPMLGPQIFWQCVHKNCLTLYDRYGDFDIAFSENDPVAYKLGLRAVCIRFYGLDVKPQQVDDLMKKVTWWSTEEPGAHSRESSQSDAVDSLSPLTPATQWSASSSSMKPSQELAKAFQAKSKLP